MRGLYEHQANNHCLEPEREAPLAQCALFAPVFFAPNASCVIGFFCFPELVGQLLHDFDFSQLLFVFVFSFFFVGHPVAPCENFRGYNRKLHRGVKHVLEPMRRGGR